MHKSIFKNVLILVLFVNFFVHNCIVSVATADSVPSDRYEKLYEDLSEEKKQRYI